MRSVALAVIFSSWNAGWGATTISHGHVAKTLPQTNHDAGINDVQVYGFNDAPLPRYQLAALTNIVPVAQSFEACASQLLPLLLTGDATERMKDIRREMMDMKNDIVDLVTTLSSASQQFHTLKRTFNMVVDKFDKTVNDGSRFRQEDISEELDAMNQTVHALTVCANNFKESKTARPQKPKPVESFLLDMLDKVSKDEKADIAQKIQIIHDRKRDIQQKIESETGKILGARQIISTSFEEVQNVAKLNASRTRQAATLSLQQQRLREQHDTLQKQVDEKKSEQGRIRQRHTKMVDGVTANFLSSMADSDNQSAKDRASLMSRITALESELLPQELASLGKRYEGIHFILCLDQSGSMAGARWNELVRSVETLNLPQGDHSFSLILFSHTRNTLARDQPVSTFPAAVKKLKAERSTGGTSFSQAWQEIKLVAEGSDPAQKTVIIFMTDGMTSRADIDAASASASDLFKNRRGRMSTFIVPFELNSYDSLQIILKAGNGGKEFLPSPNNPGQQVPMMSPAVLGQLPTVFTQIQQAAEQDFEAMKALIEKYRSKTSTALSDDDRQRNEKLEASKAKQLDGLNAKLQMDLSNVQTELTPLEEQLSSVVKDKAAIEKTLDELLQNTPDGLAAEQHQHTEKEQGKIIAAAMSRRQAFDLQLLDLEAQELEQLKRPQQISGWFRDMHTQNFVNRMLMLFTNLQDGQSLVQSIVTDNFEATYLSVKTIEAALRKPVVLGLPREEQLDLVLRYYKDIVNENSGFIAKISKAFGYDSGKQILGTADTYHRDLAVMFSYMVLHGGITISEGQAYEAVQLIMSTLEPQDLIFVWTGKEDSYDSDRSRWREHLEGKVKHAVSKASKSASVRKCQDALDKKSDELKRKNKKVRDLKDENPYDPEIKELQEELTAIGTEMQELRSNLEQEMDNSVYFTDALRVIVRSVEKALRENIMHRELKEMQDRIERYQKLFNQVVMPFVQGLDNMQQALLESSSSAQTFTLPDEQSIETMLLSFILVPRQKNVSCSEGCSWDPQTLAWNAEGPQGSTGLMLMDDEGADSEF